MYEFIMNMRKSLACYLKRYKCTLLVTVGIWYLSLLTASELPNMSISLWDKWAHFVAYGTLTTVFWWEHLNIHKNGYIKWWKGLLVTLLPFFMGCLLELLQEHATSDRHGDWMDTIANSTGVVLGTFFGLCIKRYYSFRSSRHKL